MMFSKGFLRQDCGHSRREDGQDSDPDHDPDESVNPSLHGSWSRVSVPVDQRI